MADPLLTEDAPGLFNAAAGAGEWGIFADGAPVVTADQVNSFRFRKEWPISDYQVERGAFESYDKVELPFEPVVVFMTGGSPADRQALLASIERIAGDLNLYDVVTPEKVYLSSNVTTYDYERNGGMGAGTIRVAVHLKEIRVTAQAQYNTATPLANTKSPTAVDQANAGTVQPAAAPASVTSSIDGAINTEGGGGAGW